MRVNKLDHLKRALRGLGKVAVAFSGGADSTFLLAVCADAMGAQNVLAVTAVSATYPAEERDWAERFARERGVRHILLDTDEFADERFLANPPERCYFCKKDFYAKLIARVRTEGFAQVVDGSNVDDQGDYRPGMKAKNEYGVKSPLAETGLTKAEIRRYSKRLGLLTWNKPANPCLASRFPYGERITADGVQMVGAAERFLREQGFALVRVRHHGKLARIEVAPKKIRRLMTPELRDKVTAYLRQLGYTWVSVDLTGYRMGSLNEALPR
jgi:uncharacterized protein